MDREWTLPFAVGIGIIAVATLLTKAFDWTSGVVGSAGMVAVVVGVLLRSAMVDARIHGRSN